MESKELSVKRERAAKLKHILSISNHAIALKTDGTVITCGENFDKQRNLGDIENAIAVSCGSSHSVVHFNNGVAKAFGGVLCEDNRTAISDWPHMASVICSPCDTAGIDLNGNVRFQGSGLFSNSSQWRDITMLAVGFTFMLGLKANGNVLSCESNNALYYNQSRNIKINTETWNHIIEISCGKEHAVALKHDGTVVACGKNAYGQCEVSSWTNIISVSCGAFHTLGLRADGTVVACGNNNYGQCNINDWKKVSGLAGSMWCDSSAAICEDGMVLICGNTSEIAEAGTWRLFDSIDTYDDECYNAKQNRTRLLRRQKGLCVHCGGHFKGFFHKHCSVCGQAKDY